jgi:UDP-N-acetylglucosamine 2-epimerase (non-hydrolysing)
MPNATTHTNGHGGVVSPLPQRGDDAKRVMFVLGTRPETIKLAPVIARVSEHERLRPIVTVVRQHQEILDHTLDVFGLSPDAVVDFERHGARLAELTSRVLEGVARVIDDHKPDMVMVQGDTTTAYAAALAAFYANVPVGHVEAGLRTNNLNHPYPEELNRQMIGRIAELHFAPTRAACRNLMREGVHADKVFVTGNTVVDALLSIAPDAGGNAGERNGHARVLVTAHRRENWGHGLDEICRALRDIASAGPVPVEIMFVVHPNPIVREAAEAALGGLENVTVSPPLPYREFVRELASADLILTDSGGIQEEAPTFGIPVVILRETTERMEGVEAGNAVVAGTRRESIRAAAINALSWVDKTPSRSRRLYGDGRAARRIVNVLLDRFFEQEEEQVSGVPHGALHV